MVNGLEVLEGLKVIGFRIVKRVSQKDEQWRAPPGAAAAGP